MGRLSGVRAGTALVAVLLGLAGPTSAADLVRNGAFHDGADNAPAEWRSEAWARDGAEFTWTAPTSEAPGSADVRNVVPNDTRWCQTITVQPGATYRVSTRVRTSNVGTGTSGAHIAVEPRIVDSSDLRGTADWQRIEVEARAGEERQWDVCLRLGSYANLNTGTASFTDVRVLQIGAAPAVPTVSRATQLIAWVRASGYQTALPLLGGALLALGLGIGRSRRAI